MSSSEFSFDFTEAFSFNFLFLENLLSNSNHINHFGNNRSHFSWSFKLTDVYQLSTKFLALNALPKMFGNKEDKSLNFIQKKWPNLGKKVLLSSSLCAAGFSAGYLWRFIFHFLSKWDNFSLCMRLLCSPYKRKIYFTA